LALWYRSPSCHGIQVRLYTGFGLFGNDDNVYAPVLSECHACYGTALETIVSKLSGEILFATKTKKLLIFFTTFSEARAAYERNSINGVMESTLQEPSGIMYGKPRLKAFAKVFDGIFDTEQFNEALIFVKAFVKFDPLATPTIPTSMSNSNQALLRFLSILST